MKLTKREKRFITLLVVVSVFSIYYVYFYQPLAKYIEMMSAEIKMGEETLRLKKTKQDEIVRLKEELQTLMEEITELLSSLPSPDDPGLLVHLYQITAPLATREYIEIGDVEVQTEFLALPVYISINTDYNRLKEMLRLLEHSPYRNRIESLSVQTGNDGNNINVNIMLKFFFKLESDNQDNEYPFMDGRFGKGNPFQPPAVEN